jgi:hypothetical protein
MLATVSVTKFRTTKDLQRWYESQDAHQFVGKAGESHRVFIASADTFGSERPDDPWKHFTNKNSDFTVVLDFMSSQTGAWDLLLFFDGRNLADRRIMDPIVSNTRNLCEIWIIYDDDSSKRHGRRVAWSSDNKEFCWISLPVSRVALPTKERAGDVAKWAESTHASYFMGVPQAPWRSLPLMSVEDKAALTGKDEADLVPPTKIFDADQGVPLYWQERKTVEFWRRLFRDLDAKLVVDLSPGSGSAGRAAMRSGISYVAACRDDTHANWLGNILDREACELIVKSESPLFEQDLAALIRMHFAEILTQLARQATAQDAPLDDDGDQ